MDEERKKMEHQKIINQIKAIIRLMHKQESIHKKVMKLLREMINIHNHVFELQMLTNGLSEVRLQSPDIQF